VAHAPVIYGGTQPHEFSMARLHAVRDGSRNGLSVLYAGRLIAEKGIHTAIRAIGLINAPDRGRITLDIVGRGTPSYQHELEALVESCGLADRVRFLGSVPHAAMPDVLAGYDVLVFPSEWDEPFGRSMVEAMCSGLVVVGTATGGAAEVLEDGETGLTFPPGDEAVLAAQLERLLDEPGLHDRLVGAGRRRVEERFTLTRMVDELEGALHSLAVGH